MSISETASKNHEELFPNHKSTLKVTDPELIEIFDNFAFDEVLAYGNLDTRTMLKLSIIRVLKFSKLRKPKHIRLIVLIELFTHLTQ